MRAGEKPKIYPDNKTYIDYLKESDYKYTTILESIKKFKYETSKDNIRYRTKHFK